MLDVETCIYIHIIQIKTNIGAFMRLYTQATIHGFYPPLCFKVPIAEDLLPQTLSVSNWINRSMKLHFPDLATEQKTTHLIKWFEDSLYMLHLYLLRSISLGAPGVWRCDSIGNPTNPKEHHGLMVPRLYLSFWGWGMYVLHLNAYMYIYI